MPRRNNQPKHQKFEFNSRCTEKRRFVRKNDAERAVDDQMLQQPNLTLHVYKCELCLGWHITRQSNSV
jgi:hypothetical protein